MKKTKEVLVYRRDVLLKSVADKHLEEIEFLQSKTCYNEQGKVVCEIQYNPAGEIVQQYEYDYNDKGLLIMEKMVEDSGMVAEHKTYEHDEDGLISKEMRHYMDESYDTVKYSYNDEKQLIRKEIIDFDGDLESIEVFDYKDKQLVRHQILDADQELVQEKNIQYDVKNRPVEVREFDAMADVSLRSEFEYYQSGTRKSVLVYQDDNLIEKTLMKEDKDGRLIQIMEENQAKKNTTNMVYDDFGNIIGQEEFDRNGELVSKVNRRYNEDNDLLESDVFMHGGGMGLSRKYKVRHEYVFF